MKSELSDQEKQQLQDIEKFNSTTGRQGWHVKNKRIEEQKLSRVELTGSSMVDVDLLRVPGREAVIVNSKFEKVKFVDCDFPNSSFTNVEFTDCDLTGSDFMKSRFSKCTFNKCRAERLKMEDVTFKECTFDRFTDRSGIYTRAEFLECRLTHADWLKSSLYYAHLDSSVFTSGVLDKVQFSNARLTNVKFSDLTIDACSFQEAVTDRASFEKCNSDGITFGKAKIDNLSFIACDGFNSLTVTACECRQIEIIDCPGFSEAQFYLSKFAGLFIKNSRLAYLDCDESEYDPPFEISNSIISGATFLMAKVKGLTIENSSFDDYLVLTGATFENLALKNVKLDDKIDIDAKNVTYINSDRFSSE